MKLKNAIKKCERAGFTVIEERGTVTATRRENEGVRFFRNGTGESATCFHTFNPRTGSGRVFGWPSLTSILKSYGEERC